MPTIKITVKNKKTGETYSSKTKKVSDQELANQRRIANSKSTDRALMLNIEDGDILISGNALKDCEVNLEEL